MSSWISVTQRWVISSVLVGCSIAMIGMPQADAQIAVSEMIVDMVSPDDRHDIIVGNTGDETVYVAVEINELINPGMPDQTEINHRSPAESGILVSPNKLVLGAGERAVVRMAVIDRPDTIDRVYQVIVTPVLGEQEQDETVIRLLVAYGVLVIVRPEELMPDLVIERQGRLLTAENHGNTMVQLGYGRQCNSLGEECTDLPTKRVYPGGSWQVELSYETPVQFSVTTGGETTVREF